MIQFKLNQQIIISSKVIFHGPLIAAYQKTTHDFAFIMCQNLLQPTLLFQ